MRSQTLTADQEKGGIKYLSHRGWEVYDRIPPSAFVWPRLKPFGPMLGHMPGMHRDMILLATPGLPVVWRKHGPGDWLVVIGTEFPMDLWYDGGLPGVSAMVCEYQHDRPRKWKQYFFPCQNPRQFQAHQRASFRFPYNEAGKHSLEIRGCPLWEPRWPILRGHHGSC